jgi:tRNA-dihydrouridine synthase C
VRPLPFTAPALLAPMEGVTEPCFRDLVLARNPPEVLGGAFTEFARVVGVPLPRRTLRAHLGPWRHAAPVGVQLMGADVAAVAESARRAEEVGAPLVDLNFGCPAKGALRGCAGAALLDEPHKVEALVAACVRAVARVPVTAKIRAGGADDSRLEELARAAENGGASLLTVHCRTRVEAYRDTADWERLRRAVGAVSIPVCGNGGVTCHVDLARLRAETGCTHVRVGRAALGDRWIFGGRTVERAEAARFLCEYAERLRAHHEGSPRMQAGRIKQLLAHWTAGGLCAEEREAWMRASDEELLRRLARVAGTDPAHRERDPLAPRAATGSRAAPAARVGRGLRAAAD